jgi:hypothetical protein
VQKTVKNQRLTEPDTASRNPEAPRLKRRTAPAIPLTTAPKTSKAIVLCVLCATEIS